ncbi:DnaJ family domain-containing protein [Rhodococcus sp. SJ-2]
MTERKRPDVSFETWIERQIRVAQERGDFDNLPGAGKPIPNHGSDEMWWLKSYLEREGLSGEALLPPELQLRKEIERLPESVRTIPTEKDVRQVVADLNRRVAACLLSPERLPVPLHKVDVDEVLDAWRAERQRRRAQAEEALAATPAIKPDSPRRRFRWRRIR